MTPRLVLTIFCGLIFSSSALAAPLVQGTLTADTQSIAPGQRFTLAITLAIPSSWHIYWLNPGDSGLPTRFKFNLPPGFTTGPVEFPLPHRFNQHGNIVGYGYRDSVTFLVPVTAPATPPPGPDCTLQATITWLCCQQVCLPGKTTLKLTLPITSAPSPPSPVNGETFTAARSLMPRQAPPAGIGIHVEQTPLKDRTTHYTLTLDAPAAPETVDLFPTALPGLLVENIRITASPGRPQIAFDLRPLQGQPITVDTLPLLIVLTDSAHQRIGFWTALKLKPITTTQE